MRCLCTLAALASLALAGPARAQAINLDGVPEQTRARLKHVLDYPTLSVKAAPETFTAAPDVYHWLLDNPTVAIRLWRQMGAKVAPVEEKVAGQYTWKDGQGSEVVWYTAAKSDSMQAWYAEGKVKPSMLLPASSFKAVCILTFSESKDTDGKTTIRHQAHFHVRCDSRAIALAARVMGNSAQRLGEHYLGQMQMFYGGLSWYLCHDKARARRMLVKAGLLPAGSD
jgi:hypothetical protein